MTKENDKKLEYLKRVDIKTMGKDLSKLREQEAKQERERIIKLKTEQEEIQEREKIEKIRKDAELRKETEQALKATLTPASKEVEEIKTTEEKIKKPVFQKSVFSFLKNPSFLKKVFTRLAILILVSIIITGIFLFWYWYLKEGKSFLNL